MADRSRRTQLSLREQAESILRGSYGPALETSSSSEVRQLIHELHVHQVELEIQNDQLRQTQVEIEAAWAHYFNLFELSPVGYVAITEKGIIQNVNLTAVKLLDREKAELINKPLHRFIAPEDQNTHYFGLKNIRQGAAKGTYELRMVRKDGSYQWVQVEMTALQYREDGKQQYQMALIDIEERKEAQQRQAELEQNVQQLRDMIQKQPELIARFLPEGVLIFVNESYCRYFGRSEEELLGSSFWDFIVPEDRVKAQQYLAVLTEDNPITTVEVRTAQPAGGIRWQWLAVRAHFDDRGAPVEYQVVGRDVTERKEAEERAYHLSFHDSLTGLYNRAYLEEEMNRLETQRQIPTSLLLADLNGLKLVNDTYGHSQGDEMLQAAARVLQGCCRADDIIGRWGGDEFLVLLPKTGKAEVERIRERMHQHIEQINGSQMPISLAVGIATRETKEQSLSEILKLAEDDMYKNKVAQSRAAQEVVLKALLGTLEETAQETKMHIQTMQQVASDIGKRIGLPLSELERLELAIRLHDIGKIAVPADILRKEEPLTDAEWERIKEHPDKGYQIARATEEFAHVAEEIHAHHERWDGGGYPRGLKGREIPLLARIIALVDSYERMVRGKPYQSALSKEAAVAQLEAAAGASYDPELVEVFVNWMKNKSNGD